MAISTHLTTFAGLDLSTFEAGHALEHPDASAWALRCDYDDNEAAFLDLLRAFAHTQDADKVRALVIGAWDGEELFDIDSSNTVAALVELAPKLPSLRALFVGDITYEEAEISWIQQSDLGPLLKAFPLLEELGARGNNGLALGDLNHPNLKKLVVQTGGMSSSLLRAIGAAHLPQLEHLELWLGREEYGFDGDVSLLAPILSGKLFPKLSTLALCNSERQAEVLTAILGAPILPHLKALDISKGTLGDADLDGLLEADLAPGLRLDVSDNYLSPASLEALRARGLDVFSRRQRDPNTDPEDRYTQTGE
jgi:hypothetical protein